MTKESSLRARIIGAALLVLAPGAPAAASDKDGLKLHAGAFPTAEGEPPLPAELGRLKVPERHAQPTGPQIEVAVARIPTTSPRPGLPILYLEGGPGGAGIHPERAALFHELRRQADVITFDLRGSGASSPTLACEGAPTLAPDVDADRENMLGLHLAAAARCRDQLRSEGVDIAAYNVGEAARDVDTIRRVLGIERVQMVGISFGTHLALATLAAFPDTIERMVLALPEGPDHSVKLPAQLDAHLTNVSALIASDPVAGRYLSDFEGTARRALDRLASKPLAVALEDGSTTRFTPFLLRQMLAGSIVRRQFLRFAPEEYSGLERGDFSTLAPFVEDMRRARLSAIRLSMDCASGVTAGRWRAVLAERRDAVLAGVTDFPFPEVCAAWQATDLGDAFRDAPRSEVPVQLIVGTLDGLTPMANAVELARGLANSGIITVELMGHEGPGIWLDAPDVMPLLSAFLSGGPPTTRTVSAPPMDWALPQPPEAVDPHRQAPSAQPREDGPRAASGSVDDP